MTYVKSALAGLVAVLIICGLLPLLVALAGIFSLALKTDEFIIRFGRLHWHAPSLAEWLFVFTTFGIAFLWELRRLAKRSASPSQDSTNLPTS